MRRRRLFGELDELKEDMAQLREDTTAAVEKFLDTGREQAGQTRERIRDLAQRWLGRLSSRVSGEYSQAEEAGRKGLGAVQEVVESRPIASVLVALGLGFIIGRLFHRS